MTTAPDTSANTPSAPLTDRPRTRSVSPLPIPGAESRANAFRKVAAELESLAFEDIAEDVFFDRWLGGLNQLPDVVSGAVWTLNGNGLVSIVCERRPDDVEAPTKPDPRADQARVASMIGMLQKGEPTREEDRLLLPVRRGDRVAGGVELVLAAGTPDAEALELLEVADEACGLAKRYLDWRQSEAGSEAEVAFWNKARTTLLALHSARRTRDVAGITVNDGRTLLDCDRVTFVVRRGRGTQVLAITGTGRVNPRSNQVRSLAHVARLTVRTGREIVHEGRVPDLPGETREHLQRYLDESGVGSLRVVPLRSPNIGRDESGRRRHSKCLGAIVVERRDGPFSPPLVRRVERFAEHVSVSLENAIRSERILFGGLRSAIGEGLAALRGQRLLTLLFVLAVVGGLIATMLLVPWAYRVEGTGELLPVTRQNVFAPSNGRVDEVYVKTGLWVDAGTPVLKLRDDERDMEWLALKSELDENVQSSLAVQAELDDPELVRSREESIRLRGRLEQLRVEADGLRKRLRLVEAELARLVIRAPEDGTVTTADLPSALRHRTVQRGEVLVELMDDRRDWHVELEIPEHRLGHVLDAHETADGEPLPVEFVLSTHPQKRFTGRLVSIATRTGASEEHGASARAVVAIDSDSVPERRIGAEVVARIDCGDRCLGYVLFGDFVDFVRRHVW